MHEFGTRLIEAARQARAYARGEITEGIVAHVPDDVDVKALRKRLGYSQSQFARRFGFAIDAVQDWEQHRRTPERTARILLKVIEREPDAVSRVLAMQRHSSAQHNPGKIV
jgi:putative transcriptional regulator